MTTQAITATPWSSRKWRLSRPITRRHNGGESHLECVQLLHHLTAVTIVAEGDDDAVDHESIDLRTVCRGTCEPHRL
jgi:hypothetical protein